MKYTNRLKGIADAIASIENDIKGARQSIDYHMGKISKDDEKNNEYHYEQIEIAHCRIQVLENIIEYIQSIDIRNFHKYHECDTLIIYSDDD